TSLSQRRSQIGSESVRINEAVCITRRRIAANATGVANGQPATISALQVAAGPAYAVLKVIEFFTNNHADALPKVFVGDDLCAGSVFYNRDLLVSFEPQPVIRVSLFTVLASRGQSQRDQVNRE